MREFFAAFYESWLTFMSGLASVAFWFISAVLEGTSIPVSIRIAFIVAAACSMYYASYRVWKHATKTATQRMLTLETELAGLRALLSNEKEQLAESNTARLKEEADRKALAHTSLNKLKQELILLMEKRKVSFPTAGGLYQLPAMQQRHAQETKDALANWMREARKAATEVSLVNFLPPLTELDSIQSDHSEADRFAQRLRDSVDVILKRLG